MRAILRAAAFALLAPLAANAAGETDIHLTETATRMMAPDRLRASLRVEVRGTDARAIQAALNRRMAAALAAAKSAAGVTPATGSYRVARDYSPHPPAPWIADETLSLTSGDFGAVLALAGELQGRGLEISSFDFFLAPETLESAESALTATALAGLERRAGEVAKGLGLAIDHYSRVDIGNATTDGGPFRPVPLMMSARAAAAMPAPVAQASDETVSLTVSADIVLAAPKS